MQDLRANPIATEKEEDVAAEGILREPLGDQGAQAVEAFTHVRRLAVRIDRHAAAGPSHRSRATNCAAVSMSNPSTRTPSAVIVTTTRASLRWSAITCTGRNAGSWAQRRRLIGATPNALATACRPSPAASRVRPYATAVARNVAEYRRSAP